MTKALAALREVAVEVLSVEPDAVTDDARFKEDLDADSLDLVELVMGLEERFDISVPEEDLEGVDHGRPGRRPRAGQGRRQGMSEPALDHRGRPRVAVTGMGVKTPAGTDLESFWATITRRAIDGRARSRRST